MLPKSGHGITNRIPGGSLSVNKIVFHQLTVMQIYLFAVLYKRRSKFFFVSLTAKTTKIRKIAPNCYFHNY